MLAEELPPQTEEDKEILEWSRKVVSELTKDLMVVYDYKELVLHRMGEYVGTADRVIVTPRLLIVVDWKTGYNDVDMPGENLQLKAYALEVMSFWKKDCMVVVGYTMDRRVEKDIFPYTEINKLANEIFDIHQSIKAEYTYGPHCRWCAGAVKCPKIGELWKEMLSGIPRIKEDTGKLFLIVKVIGEVISGLEARLKEEIMEKKRSGEELPKEVMVYMSKKWQLPPLKELWPLLKKIGVKPEEVLENSYAKEQWIKKILDEESFKQIANPVHFPVIKLSGSS